MIDFAKLKEQRTSQTPLSLQEKLIKDEKKSYKDDRMWNYKPDEAGNASAIIRFLPGLDGDSFWTKHYSHSFSNNGQYYIELCPTTLGTEHECHVCKENGILWNTGIKENKDIVSARKRKVTYTSNILVIADYANPDNDGKVFLFQYGAKIFEKIKNVMAPEFVMVQNNGKEKRIKFNELRTYMDAGWTINTDPSNPDQPHNPFDLWSGVNFRLSVAKVAGYTNYDKSLFEQFKKPIAKTDDEIEAIFKQQYDLSEFIDPKNFKSNEDLIKRYNKVLGIVGNSNENCVLKQSQQPAQNEIPKQQTPSTPKQEESSFNVDDIDEDFLSKLEADIPF